MIVHNKPMKMSFLWENMQGAAALCVVSMSHCYYGNLLICATKLTATCSLGSFFVIMSLASTDIECLRVARNKFPVLSKTYILMGHYTHSLHISVDAKIMVSQNCPIIVAANFVAQ